MSQIDYTFGKIRSFERSRMNEGKFKKLGRGSSNKKCYEGVSLNLGKG